MTPDRETARARCIEYLSEADPGIQGSRGEAACMWACRVAVWGFDLGEAEGYDVVAEHYNPKCDPPFTELQLRRKCNQATDPNFKHPRGWLLQTASDWTPAPRDPSRPVPQFGPLFDAPAAALEYSPPAAAPTDPPAAAIEYSPPGPPAAALEYSPSPARPAPVSIGAELAEPITPPAAAGQGEGDDAAPLDLDGIDPADPFRLAQGFLLARHWLPRADTAQTLRHWGGRYYSWQHGAYDQLKEGTRSPLAEWIEAEFRRLHVAALARHRKDAEKGVPDTKPPAKLKVTRGIVADAMQALDALCRLPDYLTPPGWIGEGPPPAELVACRNGLVHVPAYLAGRPGAFIAGTPRFVSCVRTEFNFDPNAPTPVQWLQFLDTIWADDPDSVACLQEWFGYLLTPDTSLHKMLMIVGPPRAGKGTIGRVLTALVGVRNVASPSVGKLGDRFALSDLLDKSVGLFADARLSGRADAVQITEELLGISGEDARTVDVKFRDPVTTTLRTRFVFLTNELPRFGDSSGAIVSRFVFLKLTKTFADNPDLDLLDRLLPELPGILLWSLQGWKRLKRQRAFTIPNSSTELREDADALASPVKVWAEEMCELKADEWTSTAELYQSYKVWSERRGRERIGAQEHFVRDMLAALPMLTKLRKREATTRTCGYNGIRVLSAYEAGEIPV